MEVNNYKTYTKQKADSFEVHITSSCVMNPSITQAAKLTIMQMGINHHNTLWFCPFNNGLAKIWFCSCLLCISLLRFCLFLCCFETDLNLTPSYAVAHVIYSPIDGAAVRLLAFRAGDLGLTTSGSPWSLKICVVYSNHKKVVYLFLWHSMYN